MKKITELTILRSTKIGSRLLAVGTVVSVDLLKEADVKLLLNLGKARPTVAADKKTKAPEKTPEKTPEKDGQ